MLFDFVVLEEKQVQYVVFKGVLYSLFVILYIQCIFEININHEHFLYLTQVHLGQNRESK